jgi:protein-tyrosine-phosphatase/predicted ATP-grasp superfamily ATP-dependent carboligase
MIRPVLILGAEPRVSVPLARSLQAHEIPVHVASLSADEPWLFSRAIRSFTRLPSLIEAPEETLEALSRLIVSKQIDMVIPTSDTTLTALLHDYDHLRKLAHLACPPPAVACRVLNKHITLDKAMQIGVPVPRSYTISGLDELNQLGERMQFPIVCKPGSKTKLTYPFKIRYFTSLAALKAAFVDSTYTSDTLLQEYVAGHGVGIEVLMHQGEALAVFQHRRVKEVPSTGGRSALAVSEVVDPQLAEWAVQLLRALEWDGVAMVEFRCDAKTGSAALMEVNGRYWGSWALSLFAGLEFPFYQWQLAHGHVPSIPQSYTVGVRWRWTSGMLQRLPPASSELFEETAPSHPVRDLWEGMKDYFPPTRDALWSLRDPGPAVRELSRTVMKGAKTTVKGWLRHRIPSGIVEWRRIHRTFGRRTGLVFAKRRIERTLNIRRDVIDSPTGVKTIVFLCYGNIIRSPMAAALLRRALLRMGRQDMRVESAGLYAKPWRGADPRSIVLARESGVSLESHESTPISRDLVMRADLIVVMDYLNEAELLARYPQAAAKVVLLGAYRRCHWRQAEIDDPYRGTQKDIRDCYDCLETCVNELARRLQLPVRRADEQVVHGHPVAF